MIPINEDLSTSMSSLANTKMPKSSSSHPPPIPPRRSHIAVMRASQPYKGSFKVSSLVFLIVCDDS